MRPIGWRRCGSHGLQERHGIREQLLLRRFAHVFNAEKALVARVFEETSDEIGHAGEQFTDSAVFTDPLAAGEEGSLQFIGHAVERLELIGARVHTEAFGLRDGVGAAADVV